MSKDAVSDQQFGDYKLKYFPPDMDTPRHRISAVTESGYPVGQMAWHPKTHAVTGITVDDDVRRQGIGTAMWNMGQDIRPKPVHSADRTKAGDAWAKSVGGRLPRRKAVYDPISQREV